MKKSILTLAVLAGIFLSPSAEAQLLKKIQNAAQNAAQNATTQKAEKEGSNQMEGLLGGMMKQAETESSYSFQGYMVMEIISTDKKGKTSDPTRINYLIGDNTQYMGMSFSDPKSPSNTTTSIMDTKNSAMVILIENEGEKSSMAMKMDYDKMQGMVDDEATKQLEKPDYDIIKTGNTKKILGYTCDEYKVTTEDGNGIYWVTQNPIEGFTMFSPQSNPMISNKTVDKYKSYFDNAPDGTFLEMIFTGTDGTQSDMKVVEIEMNSPKTYTMSAYPNVMSGGK